MIPFPRCGYCTWSRSGGLKKPQPDNREKTQGGKDEGCIGILNDFYDDGIKWHDIECRHKKPVICQVSNSYYRKCNNEDKRKCNSIHF